MKIQKTKPTHRVKGIRWKTSFTNKKYLAEDFKGHCAYCDDLDTFIGGSHMYHVDHFAPKSKFPELEYTYDNLMYSCPYCNRAKSNKWIGISPENGINGDEGFVNPCSDEYDIHLKRLKTGEIDPVTHVGKYMYKELALYLKRHSILYKLELLKEQRQLLKKILKTMNDDNTNKAEYTRIYYLICEAFCDYYDVFESIQ